MRKITEEAIDAMYQGKRFKKQNTEVEIDDDTAILLLHNNEIAKVSSNGTFVTTAGWNTNTTRDRLSSLPGVIVRSRKGQLTLNGHPWDGEWVNVEQFNLQMKHNDKR